MEQEGEFLLNNRLSEQEILDKQRLFFLNRQKIEAADEIFKLHKKEHDDVVKPLNKENDELEKCINTGMEERPTRAIERFDDTEGMVRYLHPDMPDLIIDEREMTPAEKKQERLGFKVDKTKLKTGADVYDAMEKDNVVQGAFALPEVVTGKSGKKAKIVKDPEVDPDRAADKEGDLF